jgi:hypothetical protein
MRPDANVMPLARLTRHNMVWTTTKHSSFVSVSAHAGRICPLTHRGVRDEADVHFVEWADVTQTANFIGRLTGVPIDVTCGDE